MLSPSFSQSSGHEKYQSEEQTNALDCRVFIGREKQDATMQTDTLTSVSSDESEDELTEEGSPEPAEDRSSEPAEDRSWEPAEDRSTEYRTQHEESTENVHGAVKEEVDRSGLDLLIDSIEQFEKGRKLKEEAVKMEPEVAKEEVPAQNGLFALCEYAEWCFKEEVENGWKEAKEEEERALSEKVQVRRNSDLNRNYSSPEAELGVKKFLAARQDPALSAYSALGIQVDPIQAVGETENEQQMRNQLAELQRKYREKQRELSKLTPRKSTDTGLYSCQ